MPKRAHIWRAMLPPVCAALFALCMADASSAGAAGIPPQILAFTEGPSQPHSITIEASIDPSGSATTFLLKYGATTALGATTPRYSAGAGNTPVKVAATISGLVSGQRYFVELVVSSSAGSNNAGPTPFVAGGKSSSPPPPGGRTSSPATERWKAVPVIAAHPGGDGLSAISCRRTTCVAVGGNRSGPIAYRLSGSRLVPETNVGLSDVSLDSISCWAPAGCMAVGTNGSLNGNAAALLSGARWQTESVPSPKSVGVDELMSVSCVSASDCWAGGVMNGSTSELVALLEHWNGARWSVVGAPRPVGSYVDTLSCVSPTDCWAAGFVGDNGPDVRPLVEHWNGQRWVVVSVVSGHGGFTGISCSTPASCVVVGGTTPSALELTAGKWRAIPPTHMGGAFTALACSSANACWAIGVANSASPKPLAWQWDGTTWRAWVAPAGVDTELNGLACLSADRCVAVGASGVRPGRPTPATRPLAVMTPPA
jgi:hypothetical protein